MAAAVYASQQDKEIVLEVGSGMDIGEHPASRRGEVWMFTNADSVKMYKNGRFLKEYVPHNAAFQHLKKSPILIDDYIGNAIEENENTLYYCNEPLEFSVEGPIEIIGPKITSLRGGMGGTYVKTTGEGGKAILSISNPQLGNVKLEFDVIA